ncbi:MAG: RidA family protein [Chloroflexota bacterium]
MKKTIYTEKGPKPIGPYSQAVEAGNLVFVSGQLGLDPVTMKLKGETAAEQAHQALKNIRAILEAAGLGMKNVVKTTILLKDMNDFPVVNQAYGEFFEGSDFPARATYQVVRLPMDALVEIEAVAVSDDVTVNKA